MPDCYANEDKNEKERGCESGLALRQEAAQPNDLERKESAVDSLVNFKKPSTYWAGHIGRPVDFSSLQNLPHSIEYQRSSPLLYGLCPQVRSLV